MYVCKIEIDFVAHGVVQWYTAPASEIYFQHSDWTITDSIFISNEYHLRQCSLHISIFSHMSATSAIPEDTV